MIWSSIVGALLDSVAPEVAKYYREKQEQKHQIEMEKLKGKQEWERAKTARALKSEGYDHDWEMQSMMTHGKTWRANFVLLVISIPAIGSFFPYTQPWIVKGFEALGLTPLWYQILLTSILFAVYGIRVYRRQAFEKNVLLKK